MRGITSDVDIVWRRNGTVVNTTSVTATTTDDPLVYTNSYTIPLLTTSDDGILYECSLVIHGDSGKNVTASVNLDVTGKDFTDNGHSAYIFVLVSVSKAILISLTYIIYYSCFNFEFIIE